MLSDDEAHAVLRSWGCDPSNLRALVGGWYEPVHLPPRGYMYMNLWHLVGQKGHTDLAVWLEAKGWRWRWSWFWTRLSFTRVDMLNICGGDGFPPIMAALVPDSFPHCGAMASANTRHETLARWMMANGAKIDFVTYDHNTALSNACHSMSAEFVQVGVLLRRGK